jgi:hypothetical protein
MAEADDRRSGIHARDEATCILYTVLDGFYYQPLTTRLAFSPSGKHMYFSFKGDGMVFEVTRDDGLSFFDTLQFEESDTIVTRFRAE